MSHAHKKIPLYLISDSTGETVYAFARAAMAQFAGIDVEEHSWSLVRSERKLEEIIATIRDKPGPVLFTLVDRNLRRMLKEACRSLEVPCIAILARVVEELSDYLKIKSTPERARQYELDEKYFERIEAVNFSLAHDDGQNSQTIHNADIILVGVSRTSKTPTSIYLAYRGYRTANIPFVSLATLPPSLFEVKDSFIVGLTISSQRLIDIRKNRLLSLKEENETSYVDSDHVEEEIREARRLFSREGWPVIDVSRRSVEETVATILQLYQKHYEEASS